MLKKENRQCIAEYFRQQAALHAANDLENSSEISKGLAESTNDVLEAN
jgi:hypothetical protein